MNIILSIFIILYKIHLNDGDDICRLYDCAKTYMSINHDCLEYHESVLFDTSKRRAATAERYNEGNDDLILS